MNRINVKREASMNFEPVIAIVRPEAVESAEAKLQSIGVRGLTLVKVRGFGRYKNFFRPDLLSDHVKIDIFVAESKVDVLVEALLDVTRFDVSGAGVLAVTPVERFLHLRTATEPLPEANSDPDSQGIRK